ncbi:MAG: hypothetical protein IJY08_01870 [Clostridia bacterium]|nr:hypothetical protein [Clostridia bacterium]
MDKSFHEKLQHNFTVIRSLYSSENIDSGKLRAVLDDLRYAKKQIEKKATKQERKLLLYCIDTMLHIIDEESNAKIFDFADIVHDIPQIFTDRRELGSLRGKIKKFKKKYGDGYFSDIDDIFPRFTKKAPENILKFFSPSSDTEFKEKHPVGYWVLCAIGITALVLPLFLYIILIQVFDAPNSGWIMLGVAGCFIIGIGLFNIVAAFIRQYLGHALTVGCFLGGGLLVYLSVQLLFDPKLLNKFDRDVVSFYFCSLLFLMIPLIFYVLFRFSVDMWLRRTKRISKTRIHKLKKGKRNFWWLQALHNEIGLGGIYHLNKTFTVLYPCVLALTLFTGLIKHMSIIICVFCLTVYILTTVMIIFTQIQDNMDTHGSPFVIFAKRANGGINSVFIDLLMLLFMLAIGYAHILITLALW